MKVIIKENGVERTLKEGSFEETKTYLLNQLDNLIDWAEEEGNAWNDFNEMKNQMKNEIIEADNLEKINEALDEFNNEMSWYGIYII